MVGVPEPRTSGERICTGIESSTGRLVALAEHHAPAVEGGTSSHTVILWEQENGNLRPVALLPHPGNLYDLATGEIAVPQFKHGGNTLDLDWSPDGTRLITSGLGGHVVLWDAATGEMLMAHMHHPSGNARSAKWSPDGRFIIGRSDGHVARVWDAATTEAVTPLLRHTGSIYWAYITPADRLITGSAPNLVRAWDLKPTQLEAELIADYAKLLSGRHIKPNGVMHGIPALELAELERSLRARHPELFATAPRLR